MDKKQNDALRRSRSPSTTAESVPAPEYQEWPLHGFLKRTRIGTKLSFGPPSSCASLVGRCLSGV